MVSTFYNPGVTTADQVNPWNNLLGKALANYNAMTETRYKEPNLREALLKQQLFNQYYGPEKESEMSLRGKQGEHLGSLTQGQNISNQFAPNKFRQQEQLRNFELQNPGFNAPGLTGQIARYQYMKAHGMLPDMDESSQESFIPSISGGEQQPKKQTSDPILQSLLKSGQAKQYAPSNLGKLNQEYEMAKSGINPSTGMPFQSKQDQEDYIAPYREKLGALKSGEHYVYDPESHEKIGIERPLTNEERKVETGRGFFNEVFPIIREGTDRYAGKDSIRNLDKDASDYGTNKEATKRIDNLLVANGLISAGVVNEAATLNAGKQLQVFNGLKNSLSSIDVPQKIQNFELGFKIPKEAYMKAGQRVQSILNKSTQKAADSVPATRVNYYHPEKHLKTYEERQEALQSHKETITVRNKKTGQVETISIAEAKKRGIPNV